MNHDNQQLPESSDTAAQQPPVSQSEPDEDRLFVDRIGKMTILLFLSIIGAVIFAILVMLYPKQALIWSLCFVMTVVVTVGAWLGKNMWEVGLALRNGQHKP